MLRRRGRLRRGGEELAAGEQRRAGATGRLASAPATFRAKAQAALLGFLGSLGPASLVAAVDLLATLIHGARKRPERSPGDALALTSLL